MSLSRTAKLIQFVNYRVRITILDGRQILGRFMAFDKHLNMVLGDSEELRKLPPKKNQEEREVRRVLGLVILRGEEIVSLVLEGPPPAEEQQPLNAKNAASGSGLAKAVGRGMAMPGAPGGPSAGLAGPARGVGGPAPGMMLPRPQMSAPPAARPMGPPPGGMPGRPPMGGPPPGMGPPRPGMAPPVGYGGPPRPGMGPPGFRPGMPPPQGGYQGPPRPGMGPPAV